MSPMIAPDDRWLAPAPPGVSFVNAPRWAAARVFTDLFGGILAVGWPAHEWVKPPPYRRPLGVHAARGPYVGSGWHD